MDVVKWLGNSITVAFKHYSRPTPESIAGVTGRPAPAEAAPGR